ncbi:MAG: ferredoxin reductase family protein [Minisyncoccia bacterium]
MNEQLARIGIYAFFIGNVCTIIFLWWSGSSSLFLADTPGALVSLGRLTGLMAQACLLLQIILIARVKFIERFFGNDKMNTVHRWLGFSLLGFFLAHPFFLVLGYAYKNEATLAHQFVEFLTDWHDVANALLAVIIFIIVGISSLKIIRSRVRYETWYLTHFLTYLAIFLAFDHQTKFGTVSDGAPLYYWLTLNFGIGGLFLLYRWIRPLYRGWYHKFSISKIVKENDTITSVHITGNDLASFTFEAGQYATLRFHQKGFFFPHPFSFSKAYDGTELRFSIKNLGDFTSKIPTLAVGTRVTLGGPLGKFTRASRKKNKILLIAGGVGITPIRALAEDCSKNGDDVVVLYSARTKADLALSAEMRAMPLRLVCFCSDATPEDGAGFVNGFLDGNAIEKAVPDFLERDAFVCGPGPMMEAMITALKDRGVHKENIHFERFAY